MAAMLQSMGILVLVWSCLFAVVYGLGVIVLEFGGVSTKDRPAASSGFWMGFAVLLAGVQIWHLWAPLGLLTLGALSLTGGAGLAWSRPWEALRSLRADRVVGLRMLALLAFALWIANRAMGPITPGGDSGIYHVGSVVWSQQYPVIPGLGNLHGRLAFNSSYLLYLATLDFPDWLPAFHHVGSGLVLLVATAQAWTYVLRVWTVGPRAETHVLAGSLLPAGIAPYYFLEAGGTSTDVVNLVLGLAMGLQFLRLLFDTEEPSVRRSAAFQVLVLAAAGTTAKLSFAFLGAPAVAVALWTLRSSKPGTRDLRAMAVGAVLALLLLVPWLVRGVILSGYVAYPSSPHLGLDVDWRVHPEQVVWQNKEIRAWARYPFEPSGQYPFHDDRWLDEVNQGWFWFPTWVRITAARADIVTVPLILFLLAAGLHARLVPRGGRRWRRWATYLAVPFVGLILWFVTAPADRFAGATFWMLGAGTAAIVCRGAASEGHRTLLVRSLVPLSIVLVLISAGVSAGLSHARYGWAFIVEPGGPGGYHAMPEPRSLHQVETRSGLEVYQADNQCWEVVPCVGWPVDPDLEARVPGDLSRGFRVKRLPPGGAN